MVSRGRGNTGVRPTLAWLTWRGEREKPSTFFPFPVSLDISWRRLWKFKEWLWHVSPGWDKSYPSRIGPIPEVSQGANHTNMTTVTFSCLYNPPSEPEWKHTQSLVPCLVLSLPCKGGGVLNGPGEMRQLVKYLPHKQQGLCSGSQNPHKRQS